MKKIFLFIIDNFRIYGLPLLAVVGISLGINTVRAGSEPRPVSQPVSEPTTSIYKNSVAGAGMVESTNENTAVATNIAGVLSRIFVAAGQKVKAGDALFEIDSREQKAEQLIRESTLAVAEAQRADAQSQYDFFEKIKDKGAVSADEMSKKRNALLIAEAKVTEARHSLEQVMTTLDRLTVRSPVDAEVLKVNARAGEFASSQNTQSPLLLLGKTDTLWVRVDIDENDAWRVEKGARARAALRGNSSLAVDLKFVRFEPYVIPKRSLTGDNAERVDTRVLQIIYEFEPSQFPVYVGQLMDVYIEAKAHG